jgi:hypothetical protein
MILAFLPIGLLNCCKKLRYGGRNGSRYFGYASFQTLVCLATKFSSEKLGKTLDLFDVFSRLPIELIANNCIMF